MSPSTKRILRRERLKNREISIRRRLVKLSVDFLALSKQEKQLGKPDGFKDGFSIEIKTKTALWLLDIT